MRFAAVFLLMLVAVVAHREDITASALGQSKTGTTNLGRSTVTHADTYGGERLLRSAPDAKDSVVDAEERGAMSTLTKKFSELKTKAVNSVKTSWWASIEKSDDAIKQKLGLTGLSGSKLTSHPNYKVYLQFRYKAEGKMMSRMLDNEVSPSVYWSELGLTTGVLTKAQFTNLKSTDEFKSYMRYAEKYDDAIYHNKNSLFEPPIHMGGHHAELSAKAEMWAHAKRPRWYVKEMLGLDNLPRAQQKVDEDYKYYLEFVALRGIRE